MREPKTIGIIGGMGPAAAADLFSKLVAATKAERDQDHLRILIDNNPRIPNRNDAIAGTGPTPGPHLAAMARGLENSGADFLVIACNTAHYFAPDIVGAVRISLLSMVDVTVDAAIALGAKRVGLLAANGCLRAGLYQDAFARAGVEVLVPDEQARLMELIFRIKAGDLGAETRAEVKAIANALVARGADVVVAACTEVPLVLDARDVDAPYLSSTDVLVERAIAHAFA